ncbi:hypothetical protein TMM008_06460 [Pseudomonas sp. 008]|jgi:hypothetical protein|nr:hypothetical protein TMM008_06460 [Pseudomonas sp. 008]
MVFAFGEIPSVVGSYITHALYLPTQDGYDLLQVAQQRMMGWKAPV